MRDASGELDGHPARVLPAPCTLLACSPGGLSATCYHLPVRKSPAGTDPLPLLLPPLPVSAIPAASSVQDLAALWHFNDPELDGLAREAAVARDSSGRGNHLSLYTPPTASLQTIEKVGGGWG